MYTWHFFQQLRIFISYAHFLHLVEQIGEHAAGDLEGENFRINWNVGVQVEVIYEIIFDTLEVICQIMQERQADAGVISESESCHGTRGCCEK